MGFWGGGFGKRPYPLGGCLGAQAPMVKIMKSVSFCNFLHRNAFCTTTTEERLNSAAILYVHHEIHVCDAVDLKSIENEFISRVAVRQNTFVLQQQLMMLSAACSCN